jgi:tetratricopeptide (TPR) repeat protein
MNYKTVNNITGWIVFAIATYVFVSTIEPTASFWDCGEFIATAYKLQVGHPPGAPFFMLVARLFSMFVAPEQAAKMINILSALCSSFTILFLFWSITALAKKIVKLNGEEDTGKTIAIIGSGAVGALAYTFSDSFWFSAVEGEVYAMSSLFTALVFWAILKWEGVANEKYANRWLVLIAYLIGLSVGVHLLNLLAIPAMTFVYYFKKYKTTTKGLIWAGTLSVIMLGAIQGIIIPWTVILASKFELLFVNSFGLPFNSGLFFYVAALVAAIAWGLRYTIQKQMVAANTIILCTAVILIGYSTFATILIRSSANPPMDENNPENAFTLLSYLNREQYGDRPLLYGQYFNSPLDNKEPYKDGNPVYYQDKEKGKYVISDDKKKSVPNYAREFCSVFPRMYSPEGSHTRAYKTWSEFEGRPIRYNQITGENKMINKPTMGENLKFFFRYQIGWMYWRYFMWNFAGRQNDIQGHGDILDGNWISGISAIDEARLGPQDKLPSSMTDNQAHNKFYLLPLILGLIGLIYQVTKTKEDFFVVLLLFFFTGIAIVIYLNQYPYQPRERDYAYAASFYAFAIWIGLGVLALYDSLGKSLKKAPVALLISALCLAVVPGIMAKEGWDDHDRSNTYTARDFAKNYLASCAPNAILFTNGDNDTFPLWYVQEVEGFRTDVRVCNLSLLNTDWYIDQMKKQAYDSPPVPFKMPSEKYRQGTRDYVPIFKKSNKEIYLDVKEAMDFITDDKNMATLGSDRRMNYFPTNLFSLKADTNKVLANGTVPEYMKDRIVPEIQWSIEKSYVLKNDMMILDLLAHNNWERPIYFAITTGNSAYIGLEDYFQLEGLAYRLVPVKAENADGQTGRIDTELMYDNLMNKFSWGGMGENKIYLNENNRRMCMNLRNNFSRLAEALIKEGKKEKALAVLDKCMEVMPEHNVPYDFFLLPVLEAYYKAGGTEKANAIVKRLVEVYDENLQYFLSLDDNYYATVSTPVQQAMSVMYRLNSITNKMYPQEELGKMIEEKFNSLQTIYTTKESVKKLGAG